MSRSLLLLAFGALTVEQGIAFTSRSSVVRPTLFRKDSKTSTTTTTTSGSRTRLQLSPSLVSSIASPLASVSVLAFVVLFHEAGHYLAARSLGITVEEFSVGVGPKIAGFVAGKEEFSLRAFPLGGYVRFPENYNTTLVQQQELQLMEANRLARKEKRKQKLQEKSPSPTALFLQKFLPFANNKLEEKKQKQSWWSKNFSTNRNKKVTAPSTTKNEVEIDYYDDPDLLQNRPWAQRAMVLSGGIISNLILAFLCFFGEITLGNGLPHPVLETGAVVSSMRPNAASSGILKPGDVILGVNGVSVSKATSLTSSQRAISGLISDIRATPLGNSVHLEVKRPTESTPMDVVVMPQPMATNRAQQDGPQSLGVMLRPNYVRTELIRTSSPGDAAVYAGRAVMDITKETAESLAGFLGQLVTPNGAPPSGQISGPIGLIRTGSEVVKRNDVSAVVSFAAAISVNLAVINALPLPALDGGQLVFVAAEAVTRKKVDQRLQEGITAATLLFLIVVSVGTALGDVESIFAR